MYKQYFGSDLVNRILVITTFVILFLAGTVSLNLILAAWAQNNVVSQSKNSYNCQYNNGKESHGSNCDDFTSTDCDSACKESLKNTFGTLDNLLKPRLP